MPPTAAAALRLVLPETGTFRFDVKPEIGWNEPVTSGVRRRVPGSAGRARMRRYLHTEAGGEATLLRPMSMRTAIQEASDFPLSDYQID